MQRILSTILMSLCAVLTISAQTFLDELRTENPEQGKVTITQSQEIDQLVNGKSYQPRGESARTDLTQDENRDDKDREREKEHESTSSGKVSSSSTQLTENTDNAVVDTRKKVMKNAVKTQGYRVQVYSGGNTRSDKLKAETAGAAVKGRFPQMPVYVHFYSPSWKCRVGNFKNVEDARKALSQIKAMGYPQACIVKGTINVGR